MTTDGTDNGPRPPTGLLTRLRESEPAARVLAWHDVDLDRDWCADDWELALESGESLVGLASASDGAAFLLCGGDERRPVVHYDAADAVTVLGRDLAEAVELLIGVPHLADTIHTLAREGVDSAVERHEEITREILAGSEPGEHPYRARERAYLRTRRETQLRVAEELGVRALPLDELLGRWAGTAAALAPELTVLWTQGGETHPIPHRFAAGG
jgi:hypothetical protein